MPVRALEPKRMAIMASIAAVGLAAGTAWAAEAENPIRVTQPPASPSTSAQHPDRIGPASAPATPDPAKSASNPFAASSGMRLVRYGRQTRVYGVH